MDFLDSSSINISEILEVICPLVQILCNLPLQNSWDLEFTRLFFEMVCIRSHREIYTLYIGLFLIILLQCHHFYLNYRTRGRQVYRLPKSPILAKLTNLHVLARFDNWKVFLTAICQAETKLGLHAQFPASICSGASLATWKTHISNRRLKQPSICWAGVRESLGGNEAFTPGAVRAFPDRLPCAWASCPP